jgi:hypothetical protein
MTKRGCGDGEACVDHDHATRKFRGLICSACNKILGIAKDSEETLLNASAYLKRSRNE